MKRALVIASTAGFIRGFLMHDIQLLQEMGYEVHCAANGNNHSFDAYKYFCSLSIPFHQIDFSLRSPFSKDTLRAAKQFAKLRASERFDVIHCHTPIVGVVVRIMGLYAHIFQGCKIIYTTHGLAFSKGCPLKDKLIYGGTEWLCSFFCNGIITINREDYSVMKSFGCRNVYYIRGVGVDTNRFHNIEIDRTEYRNSIGVSEDDIMVLAVGELSKRKNHKIIIEALSKINDSRFVLVICGKAMDGEGTFTQLKEMAEEKKVRVQFLGFRRDIPQITHCADIAVIPSLREGLGLAGIEALASGVPVVGAAVQGIKDYVIDGQTGYLCDPENAADFARYIRLLSDSVLREKMKPQCIQKAEDFSMQVSYRQVAEIYNELLADKGMSRS